MREFRGMRQHVMGIQRHAQGAQHSMRGFRNALPRQPQSVNKGMQSAANRAGGSLIDNIKRFEGYSSKPYWDYKQYTSGYGTRASGPHEIIDRDTAESRLRIEVGKAQSAVEKFAPNAPQGVKDALTDLTYNAGSQWMNQKLGQDVRAGNYQSAQRQILGYNHAGGKVLSGLTARRQTEAQWFNNPPTADRTVASNDIWKNPRGAEAITPGPAGPVSEFEPGPNWPTNKPQPLAQPPAQVARQSAPAPFRAQTVESLVAANQKNPAFAPYAGYASLIPDQQLPADQWLKRHGDMLNSLPGEMRQGISKILTDATRPPQQPQAQPALAQQSQGQGFPPMPQPRPQQAPSIQPPGQAIPMGGQPNNNVPIMGGSSMGFQRPINPQIQPGLGGGTPFSPMPQGPQSTQPSNMPSWMQGGMQPFLGGGSQGPNISTADMAMPSNRGMVDMSSGFGGGSFGGGMGGGGGGDAGGGGGGGGGKRGGGVNMQAAMQMIPKPLQIQMPQVQNIKINSPMQPGGDNGPSLAQDIMQFLGGQG